MQEWNSETRSEVLSGYFIPNQPFQWIDGDRFSTLVCGLRDARGLTGRDLTNGVYNGANGNGPGSWPGAMVYCTVLDQIGGAFYHKDKEQLGKQKSSLLKAIKHFSTHEISEREIHALIGLRNAFFHDFNLINPTFGKSEESKMQQHRFTVIAGNSSSPLVALPTTQWNGDYENKEWSNQTETVVSLYQLGELVEDIARTLIKLVGSDELRVVEQKPKGFINRYTFKRF